VVPVQFDLTAYGVIDSIEKQWKEAGYDA